MNTIRLAAMTALFALCALAQTTLSDRVYLQPGQKWTGQIMISWDNFTTADGKQLARGSTTVSVTSGALSVQLWPTDGASPAVIYTAHYLTTAGPDRGKTWDEGWNIPASPSTVALAQVRQWSTASNTLRSGAGIPSSLIGANGDFYLRTDTNCIYGPKASNAWPGSCTSLIGPAGATGATGPAGPIAGTNGQFIWNNGGVAAGATPNAPNGPLVLDGAGNAAMPATILGPKTIGAGANQLPAAASCDRCVTIVTDAASTSDCTVGSGAVKAVCYSNGVVWGPLGGGGGSGTVTTVSVASANGLSGSVANPTTTPAITLSTSIAGVLKGSGGALAAAVAGTDYAAANASTTVNGQTCALGGSCTVAAALPAVTISTTSPVTVGTVTGFYYNNSAGAMTFTLPAITSGLVGLQLCFRNYTTRLGALTIQAPASTYIDWQGGNGTAAGTLVSTGNLADAVCVVATSTTQYVASYGSGSWTNN